MKFYVWKKSSEVVRLHKSEEVPREDYKGDDEQCAGDITALGQDTVFIQDCRSIYPMVFLPC